MDQIRTFARKSGCCKACEMITKQKYVEYLVSTPINYTCTNLAEHLDGMSHDVVSNYLKRERLTARHLWELVAEQIDDSPEAYLILDDSVQDKRYSRSIEMVKLQYSGAEVVWRLASVL